MSDPIKHIVQPGETFFGIADENGVSHGALAAANPQIPNISKIFPGQVVFLPAESGTGGGEPPATQPATTPPVASNTVMRGLDASQPLTNAAKCLKNHGFGFAMRYYSLKKRAKNLTLSEAQALVAEGLQLGVVFEETAKRSLDGRAAGINDAKSAHNTAANVIGQPAGTPIYFAVDFDAKPNQLPSIKQYFEGVRDGLAEANGGSPRYKVGAYASGLVCSELLKNGLITFSWLTESTGFNGSKEFAKQKLFNLIQIFVPPDGQSVCGVVVDPNEMNPDPIKFPPGLFTI